MHQQPKSGTHHASPEPREVSVGRLVYLPVDFIDFFSTGSLRMGKPGFNTHDVLTKFIKHYASKNTIVVRF
jgi:hypothetical protein